MLFFAGKQHWVLREFRANFPGISIMPKVSSTPVRLRRATMSDLDALLALENASFSGDKLSARRMRHWISAANAMLLVATRAGELIGSCLVLTRADSPAARLYSIAISKTARGQGLGGKLLRKAESVAHELGSHAMRLEVAEGNIAAIGLYEKLGYRTFGRKPAYYEDGQDAIRMQKDI
jgi:ribosomal protein S18 acetylase RimI-like enzyme